jgi:hypothetical protein
VDSEAGLGALENKDISASDGIELRFLPEKIVVYSVKNMKTPTL